MKSSGMVDNTVKFTFCKKKLKFYVKGPKNGGGVSAHYISVVAL